MASHSPSSHSEGEIFDSEPEKATTASIPKKGNLVDRQPRSRLSVSRSPSPIRSPRPRRSRSASRSPYRENRGIKRPWEDAHMNHAGNGAPNARSQYGKYSNASGSGVPDQYRSERRAKDERSFGYNDRNSVGRPKEKRPRMRDRSPTQSGQMKSENRQSSQRNDKPSISRDPRGRNGDVENRLSQIQSVSDRGDPPVAALHMRQNAEYVNDQTQRSHDRTTGTLAKGTAEYVRTKNVLSSSHFAISSSRTMGKEDNVAILPANEALTIEERRKRREAIKAKHRGQATPTLVEKLALSSGSVPSTPDISDRTQESRLLGKLVFPLSRYILNVSFRPPSKFPHGSSKRHRGPATAFRLDHTKA